MTKDFNQSFLRSLSAVAIVAVVSGCTVAPKYERPTLDIPTGFKEAEGWKPAQPSDDTPRGQWWEVFSDPQLNTLMEQVATANQNVRIAEAQYRQARTLVSQARAGLFPTVNGSVSATRVRSGGVNSRGGGVSDQYNLALDANWEADLWGRVRGQVNSSVASAQASAADLQGVRLSMQAELALDYFQLRVLDAQKRLIDDNVAGLQTSLQITRNRYTAGVAGRVDVAQAETLLNSTQAQAVDLGVQRAQLEHAIAVLIGKAPANFSLAMEPMHVLMPAIPVGLPSELLERRPDIAAAERRVESANADVGVARTAFFPALSLSATGGFQSSGFSNWLTVPNRFWAIGPMIAQTIFDAGLRQALTDEAVARYDANVAEYRQTVLSGFQEVEDNLAALRVLESEFTVQANAATAARESLTLTLNQYKAGTVSYLNVVVAQAAQLNNERNVASILGQRLAAAVSLIKALGGGWNAEQINTSDAQH